MAGRWPAIIRMEANGWTKTTVKRGDVITGIGYQFADGQKVVRLERVVLADGKDCASTAARPVDCAAPMRSTLR